LRVAQSPERQRQPAGQGRVSGRSNPPAGTILDFCAVLAVFELLAIGTDSNPRPINDRVRLARSAIAGASATARRARPRQRAQHSSSRHHFKSHKKQLFTGSKGLPAVDEASLWGHKRHFFSTILNNSQHSTVKLSWRPNVLSWQSFGVSGSS
jgi:hypothetical protein